MRASDALRVSARMRADVARVIAAPGGHAHRAKARAALFRHDPLSVDRRIRGRLQYVREEGVTTPAAPIDPADLLERAGMAMADIQDIIEASEALPDPGHLLESLRCAFLAMSAVRREGEQRSGVASLL